MTRSAWCVMLLSLLMGLPGCWNSSPQPAPAANKAEPAAAAMNPRAPAAAIAPAASPAGAEDPFALAQKPGGSGSSAAAGDSLSGPDLSAIDPRTLPELTAPTVNPVDAEKKQ